MDAAGQNASIDANQKLKDVQSFAKHYQDSVEGGTGNTPVTHAEMSVVLETVVGLFQTVGIGVRRNQVGTAMPTKRAWERHG